MIQTVEAVIDTAGVVRFREPIKVTKASRVLVTILPDEPLPLGTPPLGELYAAEHAQADTAEAAADRAAAIAEFRAGGGLSTTDAVRHFESLVSGTGRP